MIRRSPLLLVLALPVAACLRATEPEAAPLGEPFWLDYREAALLPGSPGTVRFVELLEDSRCPSGPLIQCVSAGRVRLQLAVTASSGGARLHELRFLDSPSAVSIGGYLVQLLDVEPPNAMEPQPVSEYRALIQITAVR